jgi:hypothetical protein
MHRAQQYISNDAKISSNEVRMKTLWMVKVWVKLEKCYNQKGRKVTSVTTESVTCGMTI